MTVPDLEITDDPATVWHVGFAPDAWAWVPWRYANDSGLFDGRWDYDVARKVNNTRTVDPTDPTLIEPIELV